MIDIVDRMPLASEQDVVAARQRVRTIAALAGFDAQDQARVATAVSEIARNAVRYAHGGHIEFALDVDTSCRALEVRVTDEGPGIRDLRAVLDGAYRSGSGTGLGLVGARRLMDHCDIDSDARGTRVTMTKILAARQDVPMEACVERIHEALARARLGGPVDESRQQQRELLVALAEARERGEQLVQLNRELEDTNRGVVALYAELDEKALRLRQADETKSRFLSSISHEFRTPLNSIRALAGLLLGRVDGPLNEEQAHQVELIRTAANDLGELVEDLLDIGRIEAGKLDIHDGQFTAENLFSALRGMLRPLMGEGVALRFEAPDGVPPIVSDEGKVAQILRNFISNALKFTERGTVSVRVQLMQGDIVEFVVADTGIGIAPEDQERIFEEFVQVRGPLQRRAKGSGLGLALCRRLAGALGGSVRVESRIGEGSRFYLSLPRLRTGADDDVSEDRPSRKRAPIPVLIVEDDAPARYASRRLLEDAGFVVNETATAEAGLQAAAASDVAVIVLDLGLPDLDGFAMLERLATATPTRDIPVVICTSRVLSGAERDRLVTRAFRIVDKGDMQAQLVDATNAALAHALAGRPEAA
jgi:signal transduction histidine kinase/CheY-like chemotaxis protein